MSTHFNMISHNITSMAVIDYHGQPVSDRRHHNSAALCSTTDQKFNDIFSFFSENIQLMAKCDQPYKYFKDEWNIFKKEGGSHVNNGKVTKLGFKKKKITLGH